MSEPCVVARRLRPRLLTRHDHGRHGPRCGRELLRRNRRDPKAPSHDTSRIAWAKLMARVGEESPLECPSCGGDIRLRGAGLQETAHFEPEVRKRKKAWMASPA